MFWCTSHKCSPDQSKSNTSWVIFFAISEKVLCITKLSITLPLQEVTEISNFL